MRGLSASLDTALKTGTRRPAYKVYVWEASTYTEVITALYSELPFDLTEYITEIRWTPETMSIQFTDPEGDFHPDHGQYTEKLANGVIVRLKEGDSRVDEDSWIWTFTGKVKGQYGYSYSRKDRVYKGQLNVYFRGAEQSLKRRKITTRQYTVGTDIGITISDVLGMLAITEPERRIPPVLGRHYYHKTNQISQLSPWETIETLLYPALLVPYFDGEGKICAYSLTVTKKPSIVLSDYVTVHQIEAVAQAGEPINKVKVKYLDYNLTEVEGEYQRLGQASITTGFFTSKEEIECYWGADKKQRARGTKMHVVKSVNDNLLPVGTESYTEIDEFSGKITIEISAWVPALAGASMAAYLAAAAIPDKQADVTTGYASLNLVGTAPPGGGPISGVAVGQITTVSTSAGMTIPTGRIVQASALTGILITMMSLGSAQYEIWGTPYDLVYLEKEHIAIEDGTEYWAENEVEIKNDFICTAEAAKAIAINELHYYKSSFYVRRLKIDDLPSLEIGDIIELPNEGKYFVKGLSKTIKPGTVPLLDIDGFRILTMEVSE